MTALDRRAFLSIGATALVGSVVGRGAGALQSSATPATSSSKEVKTAGIRLIRVDGKYNVWTKKVGSGRIIHSGDAHDGRRRA